MACLFSTPEQPPRQTRETPRFAMNPEAVMAAALGGAGTGPEDMDVGWLASSPPNHYADGTHDDDHGIVSPFHDVFPKREIFDNFDLSRIPPSLFTGSSMAPAALGSSAPTDSGIVPDAAAACTVAELGTAFSPESTSPTTLTPASSSSSACIGGMHNALVFDATAAATFGHHSDFYSLHGSTSPLMDTQGLRTQPAPAPLLSSSSPMTATAGGAQSIRAPMNFLSNDERPSPCSRTNSGDRKNSASIDSGRGQDPMATTPPPPPATRKLSHPQLLFQTPKHHSHNHSITPRKRKSSGSAASSTSSRSSSSPPPTQSPGSGSGSGSGSSTSPSNNNNAIQPRKSTHNMIEKRYRTNINEKIAALRDAVPSLRLMVHRMEREGGCAGAGTGGQGTFLNGGIAPLSAGESILMDDAELSSLEAEQSLLGGLAPAHKLNKATVLSKATEYIAHLERNNAALTREVGQLRGRITDVEMILMQQPHQQPQPQQQQQQQQQQQHHHHHQHHHQQMHQQMAYDVGTW